MFIHYCRSSRVCEQQGDILQWDQSNKNYILTHGASGVDWRFYKHPLPEHVYDLYMQYWGDVRLACEDARTDQDLDESTCASTGTVIMYIFVSILVQIPALPPDPAHLVFPY